MVMPQASRGAKFLVVAVPFPIPVPASMTSAVAIVRTTISVIGWRRRGGAAAVLSIIRWHRREPEPHPQIFPGRRHQGLDTL